SVVGLFLGLLLAKGLNRLFVAIGINLPQGTTVFATRTIVVSLLVGTLITVVASLRPARRATRVPPIAAVREGSILPPGRFARFRGVGSATLAGLGFALLAFGLFGSGLSTTAILVLMGLGALLIFFGVALFSSVNKAVTTDYAVTAENNFDPIPVAVSDPLQHLPGVTAVVGIRAGDARIFKSTESVSGVDPGASQVLRLDWLQGSQSVLEN